MTPITSDDLLTRMTQAELADLTATKIEPGQADPVAVAISGALGEIRISVDPAELPGDLLRRVWLSLSVPLLYPRRAVVPQKHLDEQTWARDLLRDIRDGKHTGLQADGAWGSEPKFRSRP